METHESIKELKYPQDYEDAGIKILYDVNETNLKDPMIQAMFKRSRQKNLSVFIFSQEYYELPKRTIRANEKL